MRFAICDLRFAICDLLMASFNFDYDYDYGFEILMFLVLCYDGDVIDDCRYDSVSTTMLVRHLFTSFHFFAA